VSTPRNALRALAAACLAAGAAGLAPGQAGPEAAPAVPRVLTMKVSGAITGGTAEYLTAGLAKAEAEGFSAVAITLDTPGGALDATREIVRTMLAAKVPVILWVGPAGAQAGSAGVFLTLAADVAVMHPTSNIGAAHPVVAGGRDVEEAAGKDMARKIENDTAAFARSIAQANGRNADWAEKAVRESVSVPADEAVKLKVVDAVADDLPGVMAVAHGRKAATGATGSGPKADVITKGALLVEYEKTIRQRAIAFLADPNVVALLMLVGTLGIAIEFYNPGLVVPGVLGGFALFLAFLGMRVIPVNVGAVVLVIVGVGLLVAEAYLATHGLAAVGGAACILLGTLFFIDRGASDYHFDPATFRLSPWVLWPTPIALSTVMGFMAWKVARGRRMPLQLGAPALVGAHGEALSDVGPEGGEVFVHGEYWKARSAAPVARGSRVRVVRVDGLTVEVVADEPGAG
jgi:membrane-bound serine protease (ClpP class)